jgi:hypothetical protein
MCARLTLSLAVGLLLAGCVAPEDPAPVRRSPPAATAPTPPRANLEDAPIPNRSVRGPRDNTIRIDQ